MICIKTIFEYGDLVYSIISSIPAVDINAQWLSFGFKIARDVYTPSDTSEVELIEDDIPYAGHLYTKYLVSERKPDEVKLTL